MRVLMWTPFFPPDVGGIENMVANLVPALSRLGHSVTVVTGHGVKEAKDYSEYEGSPVFRFPMRQAITRREPLLSLRVAGQVAELKRRFEPDVYHVHGLFPSVFFHLTTLGAHSAPTVLTLHQSETSSGVREGADTALERLFEEAEHVTAVSAMTLSYHKPLLDRLEKPARVIYNGVAMRDADGPLSSAEPDHIVVLSRLIPAKGVDLLLRAMPSIASRIPGARLTVAGDGPSRSDYEDLAAELGVADRVRWLGMLSRQAVPSFLATASVVVLPSRSEASPMVVLEAAAVRRPVVATRVGGVPESVVDGKTGVLVDPEDPSSIAMAVANLLDNPTLSSKIGQAARVRLERDFSIDGIAAEYDSTYREAITSYHARARTGKDA